MVAKSEIKLLLLLYSVEKKRALEGQRSAVAGSVSDSSQESSSTPHNEATQNQQ